ncbi:unnamed protein product [Chrysodeixis includens]|uniref:Uncharacterized protein n=1 Tax=Chrysodeixis includens TaxID=689277 RepID=A0A9N8L4X9_CHRIL|nr:unnamed protein product [Chrysodeixis includens]
MAPGEYQENAMKPSVGGRGAGPPAFYDQAYRGRLRVSALDLKYRSLRFIYLIPMPEVLVHVKPKFSPRRDPFTQKLEYLCRKCKSEEQFKLNNKLKIVLTIKLSVNKRWGLPAIFKVKLLQLEERDRLLRRVFVSSKVGWNTCSSKLRVIQDDF